MTRDDSPKMASQYGSALPELAPAPASQPFSKIGGARSRPSRMTPIAADMDDLVRVTDGNHRGKTGKVLHLFRAFAFLHSNDVVQNSGVFVIRARHCNLLGGQDRSRPCLAGGPA